MCVQKTTPFCLKQALRSFCFSSQSWMCSRRKMGCKENRKTVRIKRWKIKKDILDKKDESEYKLGKNAVLSRKL
jgi:hypothetical protein